MMMFQSVFNRVLCFALIAGSSACGITSGPSLLGGGATRDIEIQVSVNWAVSSTVGSTIDFSDHPFVLNAFAVDADDRQVAIGFAGGGTPVMDLPVTMEDATLQFDAVLRLPSDLQPRSSGFALRFELRPTPTLLQTVSLSLKSVNSKVMRALGRRDIRTAEVSATEGMLQSIKGDIQPNTAGSANPVSLSLATTFSYSLLAGSLENPLSDKALEAYVDLMSLFSTRAEEIETSIDVASTHSISNYASAMISAINLQLLTDRTFQEAVTSPILNVIATTTSSSQLAAANEAFAKTFTDSLLAALEEVENILGDEASGASSVFNTNNYSAGAIPERATFANAVYVPGNVTFTDTDVGATLGGTLTITAPLVNTGITHYAIYFGNEERGNLALIGTVEALATTMTFDIVAGTSQPGTATRFWVYPKAGSDELNLPVSAIIVNVGGSNASDSPSGLAASPGNSQNRLSWSAVGGATSYNLYWSKTSPVSASSAKIRGVSSPYYHMALTNGTTYYYAVSVVKDGRESALSTEVEGTPAGTHTAPPSPPSGLAATGGAGQVSLTWTAVTGADSYVVYWSATAPVTYSSNRITGVNAANYTHGELDSASAYYYRVTAVKSGVESVLSSQANATTDADPIVGDGELQLTGTVDFGERIYGSVTQNTLTVTNIGGDSATLGTVSTAGLGLGGPFSLNGGTCSTGATLAPAATCTLEVRFVPYPESNNSDTLELSYTTNDETLEETAELTGDGGLTTLAASVTGADEVELTWSHVGGGEAIVIITEGENASWECSHGVAIANSSPYKIVGLAGVTEHAFRICSLESGAAIPATVSVSATTGENEPNDPNYPAPSPSESGSDTFGFAVAIAGSRALIGNPMVDRMNNSNPGEVYAFKLTAGVWTHTQTLTATPDGGQDYFGYSIAMKNSSAVIGAPWRSVVIGEDTYDSGAAYYFEYNGAEDEWEQKAMLVAEYDEFYNQGAGFGRSVAIENGRIAVGSPFLAITDGEGVSLASSVGAAYLFEGYGSSWQEVIRIRRDNAAEYDNFGTKVALNDGQLFVTAILGSTNGDVADGRLYIYSKDADWADESEIVPPNEDPGRFGDSLAVANNWLFVGDPMFENEDGRVYVFQKNGNSWGYFDLIGRREAGERFGSSLAYDGGKLLIGASHNDLGNNNAGVAYVYGYNPADGYNSAVSGSFDFEKQLAAEDQNAGHFMGASAAISGNTMLIGGDLLNAGSGTGSNGRVLFIDEDYMPPEECAQDSMIGCVQKAKRSSTGLLRTR